MVLASALPAGSSVLAHPGLTMPDPDRAPRHPQYATHEFRLLGFVEGAEGGGTHGAVTPPLLTDMVAARLLLAAPTATATSSASYRVSWAADSPCRPHARWRVLFRRFDPERDEQPRPSGRRLGGRRLLSLRPGPLLPPPPPPPPPPSSLTVAARPPSPRRLLALDGATCPDDRRATLSTPPSPTVWPYASPYLWTLLGPVLRFAYSL